jgi:hypothetical protein
MRNNLAGIVFAVLIPFAILSSAKEKESVEVKVVFSKTKIHNSSRGNVFTYTFLLYTQVNGMNLLYTCDQKGDLCPLMEAGKTYPAERSGDVINIPMTLPDGKIQSIKYKEAGTW